MADVQIYCEQRAVFENPRDKDVKFRVDAFLFTYAPEWVIKTEFWRMLEASKKAKIIGSARDVAAIETKGKITKETVSKVVKETVDEEDEEIEEIIPLDSLKNKELYKLCVEKGIEVEEKKNREYYLSKLADK